MISYNEAVTTERCIRVELDNGVQKFIFTDASNEAVDEWIDHLDYLYRHNFRNRVIRILVDSCDVIIQPLNYAAMRTRELNDRYPDRPATRTAFLYRTGFLASLARTFIVVLSRVGIDQVHFFPGERREKEAITWLLGNK